MTNRDFHGETFYKWLVQEYETIRKRRKAFRGRPEEYEKAEIELDRLFQATYKRLM